MTFSPQPASTATLSATTTSSRVAVGAGVREVAVWNSGSVTVFLNPGSSAVTAVATTGMPVPAGGSGRLNVEGHSHIAGITAAGSATVYITPGGNS